MNTEIRSAIYSLALESAHLNPDNYFYGYAPESAAFPYVLATNIGFELDRDTAPKSYESYIVNFAIRGRDLAEVESIEESLISLFDNGEQRLDSYLNNFHTLLVLRDLQTGFIDPQNVFNNILRYIVRLTRLSTTQV